MSEPQISSRWTCRGMFEPRDLWVGVFWDWRNATIWDDMPPGSGREVVVGRALHVYVCFIPTLVLHFIHWPTPLARRQREPAASPEPTAP